MSTRTLVMSGRGNRWRIALVLLVVVLSGNAQEPLPRPPVTFKLKPVGYWISRLQEQDPRARLEAAQALATLADDSNEAIQALNGLLEREDTALRRVAIRALVSLGQRVNDREVIEGLMKALGDDDATFRQTALFGLVEAGPRVAFVVPKLLPLFNDLDLTFREQVIFAVEKSQVKDDAVVMALARVLLDERPGARSVTASRALSNLGLDAKAALPLLREGLKHPDVEIRATALGLLGKIDPSSAPLLVATLNDPAPRMRETALGALTALGTKGKAAIPLLVQRLKEGEQGVETIRLLAAMGADAVAALAESVSDPDLLVAREAVEALKRLGPGAASAAPALAAALRDPDVRHHAGEALFAIGADAAPILIPRMTEAGPGGEQAQRILARLELAAIPALVQGLNDPAHERVIALLADLGKSMPAAQIAVPLLVKKLGDTDLVVRERAALTLGHLRGNALAAVPALEELKHQSTGSLLLAVEKSLKQIRGQ